MKNWGDDLFALCQFRQGKAFISDGIDDYAKEELVRIAKQTLALQEDLNRDLKKWIARREKELKKLRRIVSGQ